MCYRRVRRLRQMSSPDSMRRNKTTCMFVLLKLIPDHCEVLMLLRENFKDVLMATVQQQWEEVRLAMLMFTYFESFDEVSIFLTSANYLLRK